MTREIAVEYFDGILHEFLESLKKKGQLENTLVLITSDEGYKVENAQSRESGISGAWIPIIAFGPELPTHRHDRPFAQSDIQISVMDYLGLPLKSPSPQVGRSIFREYSTGRYIPFAYIPDQTTMLSTPDNSLLTCIYNYTGCNFYKLNSELFTSKFVPSTEDYSIHLDTMKAVAKLSDWNVADYSGGEIVHYIAPDEYRIPPGQLVPRPLGRLLTNRLLLGLGIELEVDLEVLEGSVLVRSDITDLRFGRRLAAVSSDTLIAGQSVRTKLAHRMKEQAGSMVKNYYVLSADPQKPARIRIKSCKLKILENNPTEVGLLAEEIEVY